jgi:putative transposase
MSLMSDRRFPRRPRLKDSDYRGTHVYFLTILTHDRSPHFKEAEAVDHLVGNLLQIARSEKFGVLAYCFMPDHLHLLIDGEDNESDLQKFISLFKQKSGYWYKQKYKRNLWQTSYYDHVLRKEEGLEQVALYILENPVRKGLVTDFRDYPFSFSPGLKP